MTAQEFAVSLEALIAVARTRGLSDEDMITVLREAADALEVGLS